MTFFTEEPRVAGRISGYSTTWPALLAKRRNSWISMGWRGCRRVKWEPSQWIITSEVRERELELLPIDESKQVKIDSCFTPEMKHMRLFANSSGHRKQSILASTKPAYSVTVAKMSWVKSSERVDIRAVFASSLMATLWIEIKTKRKKDKGMRMRSYEGCVGKMYITDHRS